MKITIFGLAGTGTSSAGKALAKRLDYEFKSSGNMFREMATDLGLSVYELDELSKTDSKYDLELDNRIKQFGENGENFVVESRLAWYFIPDSFKIKFICDFDERIRRVCERDGVEKDIAIEKTNQRENATFYRYKKYYDIEDYTLDSNFDLIIDTTNSNIEEVVETIVLAVENKK